MEPDVIATFAVVFIIFGISLVLGMMKQKKRNITHPHDLSYIWGFTQGYAAIIVSILCVLAFLLFGVADVKPLDPGFAALCLYSIFHAFIGWLMIKRNRVAFLIHTIISFNLILWIINGVYLYKRWHEMGKVTDVYPEVLENEQ
jgi:hypothetical protein